MTIPEINAGVLFNSNHPEYRSCLDTVRVAAEKVGFFTLTNTGLSGYEVERVIDIYHQFFTSPVGNKSIYDMTNTGSNRGWGAPGAEQVDPNANPDFKEVFDCGLELPAEDPLSIHTYYAPNQWPKLPPEFHAIVMKYYNDVSTISLLLLSEIARALGQPGEYFTDKFDKPMALLRGNYYPPRPIEASAKDFGIAPHTDYGCLTLLATDGSPGLEVQSRGNQWIDVNAAPGTFVINFGEMLQMWTKGQVVATPHRVVGGSHERISIPFFFNPRFDANVSPEGDNEVTLAGDYLSMRYDQTYLHRQRNATSR